MVPRLKSLFHVIKSTKNWLDVCLVWSLLKKETIAIFKNGFKIKVSKKTFPDFRMCVDFFIVFLLVK